MPYKANEPRRHKIPRARYRVTNWPAYDGALQRRGSLTVWVTPEALAAWHPPGTGRRGPAPRGPVHVVIDATGLKVHGAGEWLVEKHGGRGRRTWRKLVWGSPCQAFIAGTPIRCVVLPSVAGRRGGCGGRRGARQLRCVSSRREL